MKKPESTEESWEKKFTELLDLYEGFVYIDMESKSEAIAQQIVSFIRSEKEKSKSQGEEEMRKEIIEFIKIMHWDGETSQQEMIDHILDYLEDNLKFK